jgi:hypothetical protein
VHIIWDLVWIFFNLRIHCIPLSLITPANGITDRSDDQANGFVVFVEVGGAPVCSKSEAIVIVVIGESNLRNHPQRDERVPQKASVRCVLFPDYPSVPSDQPANDR